MSHFHCDFDLLKFPRGNKTNLSESHNNSAYISELYTHYSKNVKIVGLFAWNKNSDFEKSGMKILKQNFNDIFGSSFQGIASSSDEMKFGNGMVD